MNNQINRKELVSNGFKCVSAISPSNIALVKYWGKLDGQIPMNPSISYTLDHCNTSFEVFFKRNEKTNDPIFYFEDSLATEFGRKSFNLIKTIESDYPELKNFDLILNSKNSFPHSSGIASSASSMSALSMCLLAILKKSNDLNLVSHYSRLGSGSACRSVFSPLASWGKSDFGDKYKDEYATEISENVGENLKEVGDTIVLVHEGEKSVSSTMGHSLMDGHPYRDIRIKNANKNYIELLEALKRGDTKRWGEIIESEALELHAMMMTSNPGYLLMQPKTLHVIETVRYLRNKYSVNTYFTLDAGPNVHILYPLREKEKVLPLFENYFSSLKLIHDHVGEGTRLVKGTEC